VIIVTESWAVWAPFMSKTLEHAKRPKFVDLPKPTEDRELHEVSSLLGNAIKLNQPRRMSSPCRLRPIERYHGVSGFD
jgi:hypothetical protein